MIYKPYVNQRINRYIVWQFQRLEKARDSGNGTLYWTIAATLLNSRSFQVLSLRTVFPKWHREMPYDLVLLLMKKVRRLVKDIPRAMKGHPSGIIDYRRVYIPKGDS